MTARPADLHDTLALADLLRPALMRASRRLRRETLTAGISSFDALLLAKIRRKPGVGVCDLADEENISRPSMSSRVKRLEVAGLLARSDDAADGRRSGLTITRAGARKLEIVRRRRNDWLAARLAALSPEDRAALSLAVGPLAQLVSPES
jgi:DNA-binding MarR family transcriptional regulator